MLERITMSLSMMKEKLGKKPSPEVLDQLIARHFPGFRLDADLRELLLSGKPLERNYSYMPRTYSDAWWRGRPAFTGVLPVIRPSPSLSARSGPDLNCFAGSRTTPISANTCIA